MKTNYQQQTDALTESLNGERPALLLQCCCGPCSSYVLEYLNQYFNVTALFYNPNIRPQEEYRKRRFWLEQVLARYPGSVGLMECDYEPERFDEAVRGLESEPEGGARCERCFKLRLRETAARAKAGGYDYFCTTLTVSPHKNAGLLNKIGFELSEEFGVSWLPSDFKKREGYKRSIELSKEYGLYRQEYCGCLYSHCDK